MDEHAGLVTIKEAPYNAESSPTALAHAVTPTAAVYVRNNFAVPELDRDSHRITVHGAVGAPFEITARELRALPQTSFVVTTECAGNDRLSMRPLPPGELWNSGAMSTVRWSGVPLRVLLERAGVDHSVVEMLIEGADRGAPRASTERISFARSLPLSDAMLPDVLLALEMNGEPLPAVHGAPVRLVAPGWYGMANVKWVSRIEALTRPFDGHFQARRYVYESENGDRTPVTRMRVKSFIASPLEREIIAGERRTIIGWAWSGDGAITRVTVSTSSDEPWHEARLSPRTSDYAWTRWEYDWTPRTPGRHALRSRAYDSAGNAQPDMSPWNKLGYGNNSVRATVLDVVARTS